MKTLIRPISGWEAAVGAILISALTLEVTAQVPVQNKGQAGVAARALDVSDARALVSVGDLAGAESVLFESNIHKGDGAKAKFERSQKLAGLAFSFANLNEGARARSVGNLAISRLRDAALGCANERLNHTAARAMESIGKIEEVVFANQAASIQAYEMALVYNPTSLVALQAISRKTKEEAAFQKAKSKRGGK